MKFFLRSNEQEETRGKDATRLREGMRLRDQCDFAEEEDASPLKFIFMIIYYFLNIKLYYLMI